MANRHLENEPPRDEDRDPLQALSSNGIRNAEQPHHHSQGINNVPRNPQSSNITLDQQMRELKKMGWYWGSIGPDFACKLLEFEPDGTFLVRDSSSECYIFSMTFKLDGNVHHSRIEHNNGCFSFSGRSQKFLCRTIKDFIEQAIEFSRNGEFIFFLHRDPSYEGPVRFRMHPLSRLKNRSSLKHMCRFAILPYVKRDQIGDLSIPECLKVYLHEPFQVSNNNNNNNNPSSEY